MRILTLIALLYSGVKAKDMPPPHDGRSIKVGLINDEMTYTVNIMQKSSGNWLFMQISSDDVGSAIDDLSYPDKSGSVIENDWEHLSSMDVLNSVNNAPEYLERFKGDLRDDVFTFLNSKKSVDGDVYSDDF
jgi:hypothetical protein